MIVKTSSPTKVILCGEHFVVYGAPAIAAPIDVRNYVTLKSFKSDKQIVNLKSQLGSGVMADKMISGSQHFNFLQPIVSYFPAPSESLDVEIVSAGSFKGLGNSSSIASAFALAYAKYFQQTLNEEKLFELTQAADEVAHGGKASGIDAKTITRGKPQKFQKFFNPLSFKFEDIPLELPRGSVLIVANTFKGERQSTGELIEIFAKAHGITKKPNEMSDAEREKIYADYEKIFEEFLSVCRRNARPEKLGEVIDENHKLLVSVSTPEIEEVRSIARDAGAHGAKLTGAGGKGGAVIILAPEDLANKIIEKLSSKGYAAFTATFADRGTCFE
jgi:mevalonate kinase